MQDVSPKSRAVPLSFSPAKQSQLYDTHYQTAPVQECPSCVKQTTKLAYYSCCLLPACTNCYSGFHYLQCASAKRNRDNNMSHPAIREPQHLGELCRRCEQTIADVGYNCKECGSVAMCEGCFEHLHNSPKFAAHSYHKYHPLAQPNTNDTLTCTVHNKLRTLLTQNCQVVCPDCLPKSNYRKPKPVAFTPMAMQQKKEEIGRIVKSIILQSVSHKNKWNQIREQLKEQYFRLSRTISEKYEQNAVLLRQMEQFDMRVVEKAVQESRKIARESEVNIDELGIDRNVFVMRLAILEQNLLKWRGEMQATQQYTHRIGSTDADKLEALLKSFTVTKIRIQTEDKQNMSVRKPTPSLYKNNSNLSVSRRSLSKSISKFDNQNNKANTDSKNHRLSVLKDSTTSINVSVNYQNVNQSLNLSKQVKTQPMRNSTLLQPSKTGLNSSDKKTNLLRQSSIMTAKIEDITPVILNFDTKQSNGSRINFMSNKTEEESAPNLSLTENDHNASQSRVSKRKSDYFELRDRMRKPNIVNNRFTRR